MNEFYDNFKRLMSELDKAVLEEQSCKSIELNTNVAIVYLNLITLLTQLNGVVPIIDEKKDRSQLMEIFSEMQRRVTIYFRQFTRTYP